MISQPPDESAGRRASIRPLRWLLAVTALLGLSIIAKVDDRQRDQGKYELAEADPDVL